MSSLQIAELTGKQHKEILRFIWNMEPPWKKVNGRKFALVDYEDAKGEKRPCYQLTKTECLILASGYNAVLREKIINRYVDFHIGIGKRKKSYLC